MAAEILVLLDRLETDVRASYAELQTASVAEDGCSNMLRLILQEFFFAHLWDDILTVYRFFVCFFIIVQP